tara:strand:- start:1458 stop:1583 length:126 start_codon:yes stop_codon:yes gene_type:complete
MTNTERITRLEEAIKELHDILEAVFDRSWPEDSKVKEIVDE